MVALVEYASSPGRVEGNVIRRAKVLGFKSRNGRRYSREAVQRALQRYNNVRVFDNHADKPAGARNYADLIGKLSNPRLQEDGLFADIVVNPENPLGKALLHDAATNPRIVGLSHNAKGRTERRNGELVVVDIDEVDSVDVVLSPATTGGLYESFRESFDWEHFSESLREDRHDFEQGPVASGPESIRQTRANREQRAEQFLERVRANEHPADKAARLREAEQGGFDFDNFSNSIRSF